MRHSLRQWLSHVWRALSHYVFPVLVTTCVVLALALVLIWADRLAGGITVSVFPPSSARAAQAQTTPTDPSTPTPAATNTPPVAPTSTDPPPTATPAPPPVVPVTFTCAHAQSAGPMANPDTYMGEICVHTAPNSPITVGITVCGIHDGQVISGMSTDASGNWALTSDATHYDPWGFTASCPLPFTVALDVTGTTPSGETISGSTTITVNQ